MNENTIQKLLVDTANRQIKDIILKNCSKKYSREYAQEIIHNIENKVIEIPNPQIWVDDSYIANATNFSLLQVAKEPFSICQYIVDWRAPIAGNLDDENKTPKIRDYNYYDRYLGDLISIFNRMKSYYPTHTIEVADFGLAMYTVWARATFSLMKGAKPQFNRFYLARIFFEFLSNFVVAPWEERPNIKLIKYDVVGLMTQAAYWKKIHYKERFNRIPSFASIVTDKDYRRFILTFNPFFIGKAALKAPFTMWDIEFREVDEFSDRIYNYLQGYMLGQKASMHYLLWEGFKALVTGERWTSVMKIISEDVQESVVQAIKNKHEEFKEMQFSYRDEYTDSFLKVFNRRGIQRVPYKYSLNLVPPHKIASEVIINMDKFRNEYPSNSAKQFQEIYLMAQTINQLRLTFAKNYKRQDWDYCVKIIPGSEEFTFITLTDKLNNDLANKDGIHYITRF